MHPKYHSVKNITQYQLSKYFPGTSIDVEGTKLVSSFYNRSLKKYALKSTITHEFFTSKTVKSNSYHTSPSINNDTTSDNFSNTKYETDVLSIYNL